MNYDIRIEQFLGQVLAVVRRRATKQQLGKVIPEACGTVWNGLRSQQIKGAGRNVAVYHDMLFNLEVGVEMNNDAFHQSGEIVASSLPRGEVAATTHFGPYHLLGEAHDAVQQWCAAHRRETVWPCWEIYGHWLDEWQSDPGKIRTDVYYLLKP
jgi:effector-binding domain-containing protein